MFSVCVCFGSKCLTFFLLRDVFESLIYCLDLWLSSLLDCILFCVFFLSLKNCFFQARQLLDKFLIHRETFCLLDWCLIAVRSIEVGFYSIIARQLLDLSRSSCMHYFSHVLHLSFILLSITSYFITFIHLYGFLVPPWSSLIIFMFLGWNFIASCTLCQLW